MSTPQQSRFDYERDDARRRIRVTARQALNAEDLVQIVERQLREQTWTYGLLYDLRSAPGATSREDAMLVGARVRAAVTANGPRGPVALVTRAIDMLGAGQAYAFDGAKHGVNIEVFWDLAEAAAWLDERRGQA